MSNEVGVGIIGTGMRGAMVLGKGIIDLLPNTRLRVVALHEKIPQRAETVKLHMESFYKQAGITPTITLHSTYESLVDDPKVQLILVTTPTNHHVAPTNYALKSGKKVYLDKPIAVSLSDSMEILKCEKETNNPLIMGFTRRYETGWRKCYELLQAGKIGDLQMMQIRSIIPYTRYFNFWHRNSANSGGAFNDKCSHHFDVFNWFASGPWKSISATGGRSSVIKEDPTAPERCSECDRKCPYNIYEDRGLGEIVDVFKLPGWIDAMEQEDRVDTCVFKPGADIVDHVLTHVEYENGIKASLVFGIFGPHAEDQETLELVGSSGRINFTRATGRIDLIANYGETKETLDAGGPEFHTTHFGADLQLLRDMENFVNDSNPQVTSRDGHRSLEMVHSAMYSLRNNQRPVQNGEKIEEQF